MPTASCACPDKGIDTLTHARGGKGQGTDGYYRCTQKEIEAQEEENDTDQETLEIQMGVKGRP